MTARELAGLQLTKLGRVVCLNNEMIRDDDFHFLKSLFLEIALSQMIVC